MNKFLALLVTLVVFEAHRCDAQVPVTEFYPFGTSNGDAKVPTADDNFVTLNLSPGYNIFMFNRGYNKVFINNNGGISFVQGVSQYTPTCDAQGTPMVIPFWADVDTTDGGTVYYRETADPALLAKATQDVLTAFPDLTGSLDIHNSVVVTWHDVAFYGSNTCGAAAKALRNTFQTLVALGSDGHMSFIVFNFDSVNWVTGRASGGNCNGRDGTPAKAGFDAGDFSNFVALPGSCSEQIDRTLLQDSNVNQLGKWIFRIDQEHIEIPTIPTTPRPPPTTTSEPEDCEVLCNPGDYYHRNPEDCGSFYQCSNGRPIFQPCPSGLHFNARINVCDYPQAAQCQLGCNVESL